MDHQNVMREKSFTHRSHNSWEGAPKTADFYNALADASQYMVLFGSRHRKFAGFEEQGSKSH